MERKIPKHVAIIMDGNGRWAKNKGLARTQGHREGSKRVKEVVTEAKNRGVEILTLFAFSTENWDRPVKEINYLFTYLKDFLKNYKKELIEKGIKLKFFGRQDRIKKTLLKKIAEVEQATSKNKSFFLNIALDYGGRWDLVNAFKKMIENKPRLEPAGLTEGEFRKFLCLSEFSDPDMLVRTAGEKRISNFLIWQSAYTELYFPEVLWPDFNSKWVGRLIDEYAKRRRTFGKIND